MGCSSGKQLQTIALKEKEVSRVVETSPPGKKSSGSNPEQDRFRATENVEPIGSQSPEELQDELLKFDPLNPNENATPNSTHNQGFFISKKGHSTDSGVVDAWTGGGKENSNKVGNENVVNYSKEDTHSIGSEFESEYGKEGIDVVSTAVRAASARTQPPERLLGPRTSPEGIHLGNHGTTTKLTKGDFDEIFDPSKLIDVDKFKAANTPRKGEQNGSTVGNNNFINTTATKDTSTGQEDTSGYTKGKAIIVTSASCNQLYDEDEMALMESIEQEYFTSLHTTLPGAVM